MIILAARPSMGKTSLMLKVCYATALQGNPVYIFSREMPNYKLTIRLIAMISGINFSKIESGQMSEDEWTKYNTAIADLEVLPIHFDDSKTVDPYEMLVKAKRVKKSLGIKLFATDYIQKLYMNRFNGNRQQEVTKISAVMKSIADETNTAHLVLSQLSRALEIRQDKRPIMSDLRESGAIEQDADLILMLYRDEQYNKGRDMEVYYNNCKHTFSNDKIAEIIIRKNRNGSLGTCFSEFIGEKGMRFCDIDIKNKMGDDF